MAEINLEGCLKWEVKQNQKLSRQLFEKELEINSLKAEIDSLRKALSLLATSGETEC
jgi:SMC interacting uncharacterized protein involved in chromosome segregation